MEWRVSDMRQYKTTRWREILYGIAATIIMCATCLHAQTQKSQSPDMQALKDRLQRLEQEMQELKREIDAAQQGQQAAPLAAAAEALRTPAPPTENEKEATNQEKSESTIDLYGFAMTDTGYDFGQIDPQWFDVVRPTKLPAFANQFGGNGNAYFSVRQTRFGVKTSMPTGMGDLKTQFEFELFGTGVDAGQATFRLRHAYGELGKFGAGQTWSPFMDIDVFPNTVEYWGPNGMVFFRNVQVNWTPIKGKSNVVFALERPGASADGGAYASRIELQNVIPQFKWPDLSGHGRLAGKWGYVQVAGIVRKLAWVDTAAATTNLSGSAVGAGVNVSSNLNFTESNVGRLSVVYGHGIENYMNDAPVDVSVQNNFSNPVRPIKGVPLPVLGVVGFLDHKWSPRFSSSGGYSMVNNDNSSGQAPSGFHHGH